MVIRCLTAHPVVEVFPDIAQHTRGEILSSLHWRNIQQHVRQLFGCRWRNFLDRRTGALRQMTELRQVTSAEIPPVGKGWL